MTEEQREELRKLQNETLVEKHLRLKFAKQAFCPHLTIYELDGFVWCADCDYDIV